MMSGKKTNFIFLISVLLLTSIGFGMTTFYSNATTQCVPNVTCGGGNQGNYTVTFIASTTHGLPAGASWSITFGSQSRTTPTTSSSIQITTSPGTYFWFITLNNAPNYFSLPGYANMTVSNNFEQPVDFLLLNSTNSNYWAGYEVTTPSSIPKVQGYWNVPKANCPQADKSNSTDWVGLGDGGSFGTND